MRELMPRLIEPSRKTAWPPHPWDLFEKVLAVPFLVLVGATAVGLAAALPWKVRSVLRRQRSWRSEQRCAHCGYSLRGIEGPQCPECGKSNQLR